jgi:hypothetical protein
MSKRFTDEDGKEFEVHATMPMVNEDFLVIKPIKPEPPKREVIVRIWPNDHEFYSTYVSIKLPSRSNFIWMSKDDYALLKDAVLSQEEL